LKRMLMGSSHFFLMERIASGSDRQSGSLHPALPR
jgi:hypothetical protein